MPPRRLASFLALTAIVLLAAGPGSGQPSATRADVGAYAGLGTWVDIYDGRIWAHPEDSVRAMHARGVATLFLETSNFRARQDVVSPSRVARFVTAAHDEGLAVVAWYLPSLADFARDYRRAMAAIRFRTADGDGFDSFALDIEARVVRSPALRTALLLRLAAAVRHGAGDGYPLGAIVPSVRRMRLDPGYWPRFPYRPLARFFDVFLPMGYFAYGGPATYARADTLANVAAIRRGSRDPAVAIHLIGGLAGLARVADVRDFADAATACGVLGASLYDFAGTSAAQWSALSPLSLAAFADPAPCA